MSVNRSFSWPGSVPYEHGLVLQKKLVAQRTQDPTLPDILLLMEHFPVYTLGRNSGRDNLLWDEHRLRAEGVTVYEADRGGNITYHGPGQLVGYPILNIKRLHQREGLRRPDLHLYLRQLEERLIEVVSHFGISGFRVDNLTGVWVKSPSGPRKIAAIGIRVNHRGITSHGFALNINPNLAHFEGIVPCGIREYGVASLSELLQREVTLPAVIPFVRNAFESWVGGDLSIATLQ